MSKQFLRVYYLDMFRGTNNHFVVIENSDKNIKESVEDIIIDITETGGLWVSDTKVMPLHRILGYEICNEESKKRIEESRESKQKSWQDRNGDGRNNRYGGERRFNNRRIDFRGDRDYDRNGRGGQYSSDSRGHNSQDHNSHE